MKHGETEMPRQISYQCQICVLLIYLIQSEIGFAIQSFSESKHQNNHPFLSQVASILSGKQASFQENICVNLKGGIQKIVP